MNDILHVKGMNIRIMHHHTEGLKNDALMLKEIFEDAEIQSYSEIELMRNVPRTLNHCDVQIFLEHLYPMAVEKATLNIFIPNLEWTNRNDVSILKSNPSIKVFAKTPYVYKMCKKHMENDVHFVGWTSRDMYDSSVDTRDECLHLKGVSKYKQSQLLIDTWLKHPEWPMLHVVSYGSDNVNGFLRLPGPIQVSTNVTLYQYKMEYEDLKRLMNACKYHVCPSFSEGFGHYINEGRSTNATVFTTDLPPMNELVREKKCLFEVKREKIVPVMLGCGAWLKEESIENTLGTFFKTKDLHVDSREAYLREKKFFKETVRKVIQSFKT